METNKALVENFYKAFAERDSGVMARAYHKEARFSDPVFQDLHGDMIGSMWKMLLDRGTDLKVSFGGAKIDGDNITASWEARYTFSATGRRVLNRVQSRFTFKDDLIIEQIDTFDFWAWSTMALGPAGRFLGWSPIIKNKVRRNANAALDRFSNSNRKT